VPVIAASDYMRAWPGLIAPYVNAPFRVLGTDGFGRSDVRAALRRYFEVDRHNIVLTALRALVDQGMLAPGVIGEAVECYGIDADPVAPWQR
jgi:pyruvate dehydrogenase E1 component